jgi:uncharacterized PurR-regulated membrane protein YhhQ (DUF165 family)
MRSRFVVAIIAMVVVVTASNILVQFPVSLRLGPLNLADFLTWGAFSYPFAFLVTDLTNRHFGPGVARVVVVIGFVVGAGLSFYLSTPRVAAASGTAFLIGQLLDIAIFSRVRAKIWWLPPLFAPLIGSALDTLIFFSLAFAPLFAGIDLAFGHADGSLAFPAPLLGIGMMVPLWVSLAAGDFAVKFLAAGVLLAPYRVFMGAVGRRAVPIAA